MGTAAESANLSEKRGKILTAFAVSGTRLFFKGKK
jgi:hypothetical protein